MVFSLHVGKDAGATRADFAEFLGFVAEDVFCMASSFWKRKKNYNNQTALRSQRWLLGLVGTD